MNSNVSKHFFKIDLLWLPEPKKKTKLKETLPIFITYALNIRNSLVGLLFPFLKTIPPHFFTWLLGLQFDFDLAEGLGSQRALGVVVGAAEMAVEGRRHQRSSFMILAE